MKRFGTSALSAATIVFLALSHVAAQAQQRTLREQLIGTWTYVSVDIVHADGSRTPLYGANPSGLASFDSNGHYLLMTARANQPKFASNSRAQGTAEENKAVVRGSIAHFGTYVVNEAEKTITFQIETSTFPNWNGIEQKRPFSIMANTLKWTTAASSGGTAEVVLKRAR